MLRDIELTKHLQRLGKAANRKTDLGIPLLATENEAIKELKHLCIHGIVLCTDGIPMGFIGPAVSNHIFCVVGLGYRERFT